MTELLITYPAGSTAESSTVVALTHGDGHLLFAVDRTPCHPESPRWPDQPADRCTVSTAEAEAVAVECLEGFLRGGKLEVGEPGVEKPAKGAPGASKPEASEPGASKPEASEPGASEPEASEPGASKPQASEPGASKPEPGEPRDDEGAEPAIPCVVHRAPADLAIGVGDEVRLSVDESFRELHLGQPLALSPRESRAERGADAAWRKEPSARDSLGNPDFDKLAIVSSRIREHGSKTSTALARACARRAFPQTR